MDKLFPWLMLGGIVYLIWQRQNAPVEPIVPKVPVPPGAQVTGRIERTRTGGKPGDEVVGFAIRDWVEIKFPSGVTDWLEIDVKKAHLT